MKTIKYILPGLLLAAGITACNDLDTAPMSGIITEEQRSDVINSDPDKIEAVSAGVYANYNAQEGTYGEFFDFGMPALFLQYESRTADFVSSNADLYGWFSSCAEYQDNTANSAYNIPRWRVPYNTIYSANQVLGTIDPDTDDNVLKYYRAQALGNRAFSYWVLAQGYQFNYVGHQNDPCVPLITDENQNEAAAEGAPRATVQEIYDQILSDLNTALSLVEGNSAAVRKDKRYIDKNVLLALRARTYLCMGDYTNAAADAQAVISSGAFRPLSASQALLPGYITLSDPNWVWGINMDTEDVMGLYTLSGMMGSYTYGYAYVGMWKLINSNLWARIPEQDVRRLWWIAPETRESNAMYYTDADGDAVEYLDAVGAPEYAVVKFAPYDNVLQQSNNEADIPIIRIEEMYLVLAEAQGMGGNLAQGIQTLNNFVNSYRWTGSPAYSCTATTPAEFLDEVWFQRRVELWGEGINYFDLLRLNKPVDRTNSNWNDPDNQMMSYAFYIPAGAPVLLYQIPTSEIDNNIALTDADQNPTGSATLP